MLFYLHRIEKFLYICNIKITKTMTLQDNIKGFRLAIKVCVARIELIEHSMQFAKTPQTKARYSRDLFRTESALKNHTAKLNELITSDTVYQLFLSDYKNLTEKIRIFELILQNENTFENSKNVKKLVKRRKQLKNAYLSNVDISASDLNEMIENSLKTA